MNTERAALIDRFYAALTRREVGAVLEVCHDEEMADMLTLREGKISRLRLYVSREEALRELGT